MRLAAVLFGLLALLAGLGIAQDDREPVPAALDRWDSEARTIERSLEFSPPDEEQINEYLRTINRQLNEMPPRRAELEAELAPLRNQLAALGDPPEDPSTEPPQIALERQRLNDDIGRLEALQKRIDVAQARAKGLETQLLHLRRERFTEALLSRGPGLFDAGVPQAALSAILRTSNTVWLETRTRLEQIEMNPGTVVELALPFLLFAGGLVILLRLKDLALRELAGYVTPASAHSRRVAVGAGMTLARLILPTAALAMVLGGLRLSGLLGGQGRLLLDGLAMATGTVIAAYALGGAFFSPNAPLLRLSRQPDRQARRSHRWLLVLALVVGLDRALVVQGQAMGLAVEGLALLNAGILVLGGVALWGFTVCMKPPPQQVRAQTEDQEDEAVEEDSRPQPSLVRPLVLFGRLTARVLATLAPLLAVAGYYAASRFAFYPIVFSGAVIGVCMLLFHIVQALVSGLIGSQEDEPTIARLKLIPIAVAVLLTCGALPVLALVWGVSPADLGVAWRSVIDGFQVGDVTISPTDFIAFLIVIVLGWVLTQRFKRLLSSTVLPLTGLDSGGRDAIAAGAGYLGLVATILIAISATGVDLSNLAIVAGALSVGIGFGLQNIVNNFVSGIILLIERPIKSGDWIQLPSGMGYVKTINVRSTEVETFDRSTLFVPNSKLISEDVINWTHGNLNGRVIVPVHVAHGSDARLVERVLLEVAKGHPMTLRRPAPFVLFRGFTTDAMLFEIRAILRDVNWVLNVHSDMNFEVLRRFAEEGISIPVSQTEISIRNAREIGEGLRLPPVAATRSGETAALAPRAAPPARRPPDTEETAAGRDADAGDGGGAGDGR